MLKNLADGIILFGCCLAAFFTAPGFGAGVRPVLIALIFVCLLIYFERDGLRLALTPAFFALCVPVPALVFFLPSVCDHLFGTKPVFLRFCRAASADPAALRPLRRWRPCLRFPSGSGSAPKKSAA